MLVSRPHSKQSVNFLKLFCKGSVMNHTEGICSNQVLAILMSIGEFCVFDFKRRLESLISTYTLRMQLDMHSSIADVLSECCPVWWGFLSNLTHFDSSGLTLSDCGEKKKDCGGEILFEVISSVSSQRHSSGLATCHRDVTREMHC